MHPLAVLIVSVLLITPVPQQGASPGLIGTEAGALGGTSLFVAYDLKEAGRRKMGQGEEIIFIPAGSLGPTVHVLVRTDSAGKTIGLEAFLRRSLIDVPTTTAAARRLVRDLILQAPPPGQHPDLAKFAGHLDGSTPPEPLTNPYRVFAGDQKFFMFPHLAVSVVLENAMGPGGDPRLRIAILPNDELFKR